MLPVQGGSLVQRARAAAAGEVVSPLEDWEALDPGPVRLVVLFDPTPGRQETARRLAETGEWHLVAIDSTKAEGLGLAVEELVRSTNSPDSQEVELAAVVLEARHPLARPGQPSDAPARRAEELLVWLGSRLRLTSVETVLYTADAEALAQARQDWDFARRSDRYGRGRFTATVQRDPTSQSDLALAQLLDRLIPSGPLPF